MQERVLWPRGRRTVSARPVAVADLAIPQLAYSPSWGFPPCRVTREITADR
ncbi:MAG TPA: hypothetical protein VFW70_01920 [Methylomirabilota bacterium]|nr:hypothetical protein [Methylomirabilota bacterium]